MSFFTVVCLIFICAHFLIYRTSSVIAGKLSANPSEFKAHKLQFIIQNKEFIAILFNLHIFLFVY